jgi:hypothetical protein
VRLVARAATPRPATETTASLDCHTWAVIYDPNEPIWWNDGNGERKAVTIDVG